MGEQEWNGLGMPRVGCEVEAFDGESWRRAEWFKQHNGEHAVFFKSSRALVWAINIRPLPRAESAEERAVDQMAEVLGGSVWVKRAYGSVFAALYRAGYRKTEQ